MTDKCKDKNCPSQQICNPKTGRCVNKTGKIGQEILTKGKAKDKAKGKGKSKGKAKSKNCPSHQILNPKTGRCVNKTGKIGQEILTKGKGNVECKNDKGKGNVECKNDKCTDKNCPVHQICNPKTGRCVNKTGKIGQEILLKNGKKATPVGLGVPNNFLEIPDDCEINKVWKKKTEIGKGQYGTAYITCKGKDDCNYVLKVQKLNDDFFTEVNCLEDLKNTKNIVPKIYAAWTCDNHGYFVIEKLDKCDKSKFLHSKEDYKEITNLLKKFKDKGWLLVDIHPGNVMCKNGKFILIDFGWAVKKGKKNYPNNPLSKRVGVAYTYGDLEAAQEKNKENYFGYDQEKYKIADANYQKRTLQRLKNN